MAVDQKVVALALAVAGPVVGVLPALQANAQAMKADTELLEEPGGSSNKQSIKAGTTVQILRRNGFWVEIQSGSNAKGWAKAASLDFATTSKGPVAIDTGRLGTGNIVATSAARGLSAKDLQQGTPNITAVDKLDAIVAQALPVKVFREQAGIMPAAGDFTLAAPPARSDNAAPQPAASRSQPAQSQPPSKPKAKKDDDDW